MPQTQETVPIFPLHSPLYYPGRILPLHIFEPRYRALMRDALDGERRFAMAVFRPGWENDYEGRPPVFPTICIGKIIKHQEIHDGRFLLLLKGERRARIDQEVAGKPYRIAMITLMESRGFSDEEEAALKVQINAAIFELCGKRVAPPCASNGEPARDCTAGEIADEALITLPICVERKMSIYSIAADRERIEAVEAAVRELIETREKLKWPAPPAPSNN